ncbi:MAG: hypothetical protein H7123_04115 [Thermoleophilia bacterium]|nr:hypothetical protein [Thermoleophilia bacterium]
MQTQQVTASHANRTTFSAQILHTSLARKGRATNELVVRPMGSSHQVRLIVANGARIAVPWADRYVNGTIDDLSDGQSVVLTLMPGATAADGVVSDGAEIASLRVDAGVLDGSHTS